MTDYSMSFNVNNVNLTFISIFVHEIVAFQRGFFSSMHKQNIKFETILSVSIQFSLSLCFNSSEHICIISGDIQFLDTNYEGKIIINTVYPCLLVVVRVKYVKSHEG